LPSHDLQSLWETPQNIKHLKHILVE